MKKIIVLSAAALMGFASVSHAQSSPCGTDELYNQLKRQHPEIGQYEATLEKAIADGMKKLNWRNLAKTTVDTNYLDIPVVIHVVHDYGNEYLSDNDIINAVNNWSKVFQKQNADTADVIAPFKQYIGNAYIRLHLATKDPNGNPTKGITRRQSYLTVNAGDEAKMDQWPPDQYLNIWFINTFSGSHAGAAAYAYYPSSAQFMPYVDGIISLATYLNFDKAIPHEIGHVFNLQHTWGNTNQPGVACGDDQVDDTPPTEGHLPGCSNADLYDTYCATGYVRNGIDYPDTANTQNIMDYAYCQKMFTAGQVDRMRLSLNSSVAGRNNLWSTANLAATGALAPMPDLAPVADFSVERAQMPTGLYIGTERAVFLCMNNDARFIFRNRSWNDTVTNVSWSFSNSPANPTSTSTVIVANTFSQPGWVTVSMTANGNNSGSNTVSKQAVFVADTAVENASVYVQDFSNTASFDKWPMFNYYDNEFRWESYSGAGYGDLTSVRYRSFDSRTSPQNKVGTAAGDRDDMFTPGFALDNYSGNLNLNFYTAGAYRSGAPGDTLQVYASNTCGNSWTLLSTITGANLSNNGAQSSEFVPQNAGQWRAQTVSIPANVRGPKVFFRLRYKPANNGNDFYFDKFSISQFATEVNEVKNTPAEIKLYPNPTTGDSRLLFTTGSDGKAAIVVRDVTGKVISAKTAQYGINSFVEENIARNIFPAAGVYLVSVTVADKTITQKLIVQ